MWCFKVCHTTAPHAWLATDWTAGGLVWREGRREPGRHRAGEDRKDEVLAARRLVLQVHCGQDPFRRLRGVPLLPLVGGRQRGGAARRKRWSHHLSTCCFFLGFFERFDFHPWPLSRVSVAARLPQDDKISLVRQHRQRELEQRRKTYRQVHLVAAGFWSCSRMTDSCCPPL